MKAAWRLVGLGALVLLASAGCEREPPAAPAAAPVPAPPPPATAPAPAAARAPGATPTTPAAIAERARRLAQGAFWNEPRSIAELGIDAGQRQRLDAVLGEFLGQLLARNQAHRAAIEGWIAALAAADSAAATRHLARAAEIAATSAREDLLFKNRLLTELSPAARARLASTYPRLLGTAWVHANKIVDTSDLGKWVGPPRGGGRPRPQGQAGEPTAADQ